MSDYEPGTYTKGDAVRVVSTRADAVQAVFDGFSRQEESQPEQETVSVYSQQSPEPVATYNVTPDPKPDAQDAKVDRPSKPKS